VPTRGHAYAYGEGVAQDEVTAYMWLTLAAAQSSGEVGAAAVQGRDDVAGRMTADQFALAERRVRDWTPTPEP
jgi:TPR repeat protein